jgi:hypothetical protein
MANETIEITPLISRSAEQKEFLRNRAISSRLPQFIYEDFKVFAQYIVPKIKVGKQYYDYEWFHTYICEQWNNAIFSDGTLLTIEIGPQIGKSILTALAIAFILGNSPSTTIVYATYNERKAVDFTKRYVIKFMGGEKYKKIFPHVMLKNSLDKKDSSSAGSMQRKTATMQDTEFTLSNPLTKDNYVGGYRCYGLDQGIHGIPADVFIVDDYVDKGDSVKSESFRAKRREWFYNDLPSRLQDNSSIVVAICTRWYYDDMVGMLHSTYEEDIVPDLTAAGFTPPKLNKVRIRAEYRTDDDNPPCDPRRVEGEKLWAVHTLKYSMAKKGMYYQAVYNCDPSSVDVQQQLAESDFGYYEPHELPTTYSLDIVIDAASTVGTRSDRTAIGVWHRAGEMRYLVRLMYFKKTNPELIAYVIDLINIEYPHYGDLLIEYASAGQPLAQFLDEVGIRNTKLNFSSRPVGEAKSSYEKLGITNKRNSKEDRLMRAIPVVLRYSKPIRLPKVPIEHQDTFLRQICGFTGEKGKADDMADMFSHYVNYTESSVMRSSNYQSHIEIEGYHGAGEYFGEYF